ncbi:MAG: rhodanese-like domain-containing protein [Janthinobacterium lividum]
MNYLVSLIEEYGLWLVFANVLLAQLGLPLPAVPTLVITGALLDRGDYSWPTLLLLAAVCAALVSDFSWFSAGRRFGRRVTSKLCRISLSPDSCVRQTEMIYLRFGAPSLLLAKFIPGFASVASALAGTVGTKKRVFLLFDGLGATLWAGAAIWLGSRFSNTIEDLLTILEELGRVGAILLGIVLLLFISYKWVMRQRFLRDLRMARISVAELKQLVEQGSAPLIIDVRSAQTRRAERIPGALVIALADLTDARLDALVAEEVVVYCACLNEASAAIVAKKLMARGFQRVRPLAGGIDAWIAAGHEVEDEFMLAPGLAA